jgi:YD repeat-containing protein
VDVYSSASFTIQLDATTPGSYSGGLSFGNDDSDEHPFDFGLYGQVTAPQPEISVRAAGWYGYEEEIYDDSGSVSFGTSSVGLPLDKTFTIYNRGDGELTLDPASLTLPAGFSLVTLFSSPVAPGVSTTFTVRLDAASGGQFHGTLSFTSNDEDESPFGFWLYGDVYAPQPEISVRAVDAYGWEQEISDGGSVPFDSTSVGVPVDKTFTIYNTGEGLLTLDPTSMNVPAGFGLLTPFAATVPVGGSTSFTVRQNALLAGDFGGQVSFESNDFDESPFEFAVSGSVFGNISNHAPFLVHAIADVTVDEDADSTTIALTYATNDPGTADTTPKYDPDDYRGNITYVVGAGGLTRYEYETDDEEGDAVGQLVKVVDKPKISASGPAAPGGPVSEVVTLYERQADGRAISRRTIRGVQDTPTGPVTGDPEDAVERWTYWTGGVNQGFLESYTDARGLVTDYLVYEAGRVLNTETTDSYDGQRTVTVNSYDVLGYLDTVKVADGDAWPVFFSWTDYDYDSTGLLRQVQIKNGAGTTLRKDEFEYAPDGVTIATIDGNGVRTESTYDKAGLLTEIIQAASETYPNTFTDRLFQSVEQRTRLEYYQDGTLKQETRPDLTHRQYFVAPLLTGGEPNSIRAAWVLTDGVAGESSVASDGTVVVDTTQKEVVRREYDQLGRVTRQANLLTGSQETFAYQQAWTDLPTERQYRYVQMVAVHCTTRIGLGG